MKKKKKKKKNKEKQKPMKDNIVEEVRTKAIQKERCVICAFVFTSTNKLEQAVLRCGNPKAARSGQIVDPQQHCGYFDHVETKEKGRKIKEEPAKEAEILVEVEEKEDDFVEVETVDPTRWKIKLTRDAYETMLILAKMSKPREVQMLTEVEREINTFHVSNVHLIKQVADPGGASFDNQALAVFVGSHPHPEKVRGWVHSHVDMGVFWSGTDEGTIKRLVKTGGWLVSIVMCVDGRMRGRVDVGLDAITKERIMKSINESKESFIDPELLSMVPMTRTWDEIPIEVEYVMTKKKREGLKAEFEEKVGRRTHVAEDFTVGKPWPPRAVTPLDEGRLFGTQVIDSLPNPGTEVEEDIVQCVHCEFDCAGDVCEKGIDRRDLVSGKCPVFSPIVVR